MEHLSVRVCLSVSLAVSASACDYSKIFEHFFMIFESSF